MSEFVPGYDAAAWIGVSAPKNTPRAAKLAEVRKRRRRRAGISDPDCEWAARTR